MPVKKQRILNNEEIQQKINRISFQIYEDNHTEKDIVIVGMSKKGYLFAEKIAQQLKIVSPFNVLLVKLTINKENPIEDKPKLDADTNLLNNKTIILVDDVLNTGKALIYGVRFLLNFPIKKMSTAVLVDRNHKKYPIGTHYVGLSLSTTLQNHISVEFSKDNSIKAFLS
ncbi:MAG: phosphoribosyltransferase [Vicingus serpentipes]|nr:phosphoribosyltransferase [Vicingus serpentipes]